MIVLAVALAGGLGSAARAWIDGVARPREIPGSGIAAGGTIIVNLSGSLLIGVLAGLGSSALPAEWGSVLTAGFLGGYTTFSAAAVQAAELLRTGQWRAAAIYSGGLLGAAAGCAGIGIWIGRAVTG